MYAASVQDLLNSCQESLKIRTDQIFSFLGSLTADKMRLLGRITDRLMMFFNLFYSNIVTPGVHSDRASPYIQREVYLPQVFEKMSRPLKCHSTFFHGHIRMTLAHNSLLEHAREG